MPAITGAWLDAHRVDPATLAVAPLMGIDHVEGEIASLAARLSDPERAARLGAEVPTAWHPVHRTLRSDVPQAGAPGPVVDSRSPRRPRT